MFKTRYKVNHSRADMLKVPLWTGQNETAAGKKNR